MHKRNGNTNYDPYCNFVPGYAYYSGIGSNLAEHLVNLFEWILGLKR